VRRLLALSVLGVAGSLFGGGCVAAALVGGMASSYQRTGSKQVPAEYTGLRGKTFAVVVTADRMIQARHPGIVPRITARVNETLADPSNPVGASGYIPSNDLLAKLYDTPQWIAMTRDEVADLLGVERLIEVEIYEYRLHEPGNPHTWSGVAGGTLRVYESDSSFPEEPVFDKAILVTYPDAPGYSPAELSEELVTSALSLRLINRVAWVFYDHKEANEIAY